MSKLNIYTVEALSKRSWIPQDLLLRWLNLDSKARKSYFYDHKNSEPEKWKYIRVTKDGTMMKKFQVWIGTELKHFDSELLFTINGGVEKKSILNAINIHIRNEPFTFIKSDLSRFFESVPKERVFSLFCSIFNCSKEVSSIITNWVCFPKGEIWETENDSTLARGLHASSRIAIWCSIQFFRKLYEDISKKYKHLKPKVSYYVDDIGISILTTDQNIVEDFLGDLKECAQKEYWNIDFLHLHPEKTQYKILNESNDFIEYLWSRIYINRKDVSIEWINKGRVMYRQAKKTEDKKEKAILLKKVGDRKKYRNGIRTK